MSDALAQKIDTNGNNVIEYQELQDALEKSDGVLAKLESDTTLQQDLKEELANIDSDIESSLAQQLISQYEAISEIAVENRKGWQVKLFQYIGNYEDIVSARETRVLLFQQKKAYEEEIAGAELRNVEGQPKLGDRTTTSWDTIEGTSLAKKLGENAETLSNKLDTTWFLFLQGYFPNLEEVKLQQLAVGASFAFMDRYTKVKNDENTENSSEELSQGAGQQNPTDNDNGGIGKFNNFMNNISKRATPVTDMFSGEGMNMMRGVVGMLGGVAEELPLQDFFTKIQNGVTLLKHNSLALEQFNDPKKFVDFFQQVPEGDFLQNKDIQTIWEGLNIDGISDENKEDISLEQIANAQAAVTDQDTVDLLKKVVEKGPKVLSMRNAGRSTLFSLFDQVQGIFAKLGGLAKTLGRDFGSARGFLEKIPGGDLIMAVLGFNGIDGFVQDYRKEKAGPLSPIQRSIMNYAGSYYAKNLESAEVKPVKEGETVNWTNTHLQEGSFFTSIGGKVGKDDKDNQILVPALSAQGEDDAVVDLSAKIPVDYQTVLGAVEASINAKGNAQEELDVDGKLVNTISRTLLQDQQFMQEMAGNENFGSSDFVATLTGSYWQAITGDENFLSRSPALATAIAAGGIVINKVDIPEEAAEETQDTEETEETEETETTRTIQPSEYDPAVISSVARRNVPDLSDKIDAFDNEVEYTNFANKVITISEDLDINPNHLMAVMDFESAGFTPSAENPESKATGLIQFTEGTAIEFGTTIADLKNMSAIDQLDYVKKYFQQRVQTYGKLDTLTKVYLAVLYPVSIPDAGTDPDTVVWGKSSISTAIWDQNNAKDIDANKDDKVTSGEIMNYLLNNLKGKGRGPGFEYFTPQFILPEMQEKLTNTPLDQVGIFGNSHVGGLATTGLTDDMCGDLNKGSHLSPNYKEGEFGDGWKIDDYLESPAGGVGAPVLKEEFHDYVKNEDLTSMVFRFGGNEINAGLSNDKYTEKLQQLVSAINAVRPTPLRPITPIFVTNPTHPGLSTHRKRENQNEALRTWTAEKKYPLLDVANLGFTQADFKKDTDGNHTNPHLTMGKNGGYAKVQDEIKKVFAK